MAAAELPIISQEIEEEQMLSMSESDASLATINDDEAIHVAMIPTDDEPMMIVSVDNIKSKEIPMKKSKSIKRTLSAGLARLSRTMSAPTRLVRSMSNREVVISERPEDVEELEQVPLTRRLSRRASSAVNTASRGSRRAISHIKPSKGFNAVTSASMSMAYSPFYMQYSTNYPGFASIPSFKSTL
ncbi:hypothetical protein BDF19DRAFT_1060 [Syncephalis fuscata]|nr:hypothetical protein BDF19DRAFT_1060 [Syncephalis fuscata]